MDKQEQKRRRRWLGEVLSALKKGGWASHALAFSLANNTHHEYGSAHAFSAHRAGDPNTLTVLVEFGEGVATAKEYGRLGPTRRDGCGPIPGTEFTVKF